MASPHREDWSECAADRGLGCWCYHGHDLDAGVTVFDRLRYPVSRPPTVEELEALPHGVYTGWLSVSRNTWALTDLESSIDRRWVSAGMTQNQDEPRLQHEIKSDLDILRRIISEYEG